MSIPHVIVLTEAQATCKSMLAPSCLQWTYDLRAFLRPSLLLSTPRAEGHAAVALITSTSVAYSECHVM